MSLLENDELKNIKKNLIEGMIEYMEDDEDGDVEYTKAQVNECDTILQDYLKSLQSSASKESTLICVKETVLKLNDLNANAGHELIETDQRESICEYIIRATSILGFNEDDEDVTEEWREW